MKQFFLRGSWLVAMWMVLWRDLSWANFVSGVAVAAACLVLFPAPRTEGLRLQPVAAVRFVSTVAWQVVVANLIVAWEVVTHGNQIREAVIAVPLDSDHPAVITVVSHAIGLAPGTMVIDIDYEPTTLYVHVLHYRSSAEVVEQVAQLERLALAAFGIKTHRESLVA
jgi:multicomponent Na+:H+ antiporter subunit E